LVRVSVNGSGFLSLSIASPPSVAACGLAVTLGARGAAVACARHGWRVKGVTVAEVGRRGCCRPSHEWCGEDRAPFACLDACGSGA
jgi:hypothetical protein